MMKKKIREFVLLLFLLMVIFQVHSQERTISGKVNDEFGQPVVGVTVQVKNGKETAITGNEGTYQISIPQKGAVLIFSSIGFVTQQLAASPGAVLNVTMKSSVNEMDEVVVVGYGTQKKSDLTGAVAVVDVKSLKSQPAASAAEAMQGKAAGVNIVNEGSPGSTPQIRIRGFSTINNNEPLYVVDGVPYQGKISWLNQNDIESMQVLKDASSASIYGARANNGVVIITTKKGKEGATSFTFDAYYGSAQPIRSAFPKFLSPIQYANYEFQAYRNGGQNPGDFLGIMYGTGDTPVLPEYLIAGSAVGQEVTSQDADPSKYSANPNSFYQITKANQAGTDWMGAITRDAPIQSYQLSGSGGSKSSQYAFSGGFQNQQGILKYTGFKKYNARVNSQFEALKSRFRFGENLLFTRTESLGYSTNINNPGDGNFENNPVNAVYEMQTIIPVYDIGGNFAGAKGNNLGSGRNPMGSLYRGKDNFTNENRVFGNVFAEIDIIKNLTARTSFGLNLDNYNSQVITYPNLEDPVGSASDGYSATQGYGTEWTWTNTLKYTYKINDDQVLNFLAGTEAIRSSLRNLNGARNGFFLLGDQNYYYLNAGSTNIANSETGSINTLASLFGRVDYSLKDRYLFSATIRRDGSSNFGPEHKYGNFPAASAAWRISKEDFFRNIGWVDDLKFRVGYGETGNQNIPANNALDVYQSLNNTSYYPMNGSNALIAGVNQNQFGNPQLKWEQLKSVNLGLDFTLFKMLFDGSLDLYKRTTSDMLFPVPLPSQTAGTASSPYVNAGSMSNKGVEVVLNYHVNQASDNPFKLDVGVNFARNINEIEKLAPGIDNSPYGNFRSLTTTIFKVGQPYGEFYGYKQAGIFQNESEVAASTQPGARVGGIKFADVNGDNKFSEDDRTTLGSPLPAFTYGININITYKNFDLSTFFYGSQGNKLYNINKYYSDFQVFPSSASTRLLDAWSPTNTGSNIPAPSSVASAIEYQSSSYYVENGSYFRLKNLQLGYTFRNTAWEKQVGFSNIRIYGSVTNLFTITPYSGLDPEVTQINQGFSLPGLDYGSYPGPRQFLLGINASF